MTLLKKHIRNDAALRSAGFDDQGIKSFRKLEAEYFDKSVKLDEANASKDYDTAVELEDELPQLEFALRHQGENPKEIPVKDLREFVQGYRHEDGTITQYHRKIKNPASGIRAFCVRCMGGQTAEVRKCQATNCPLWAFRMGTNPLSGKALPPVEEVEVDFEDDAVEVEEDDNEDAE